MAAGSEPGSSGRERGRDGVWQGSYEGESYYGEIHTGAASRSLTEEVAGIVTTMPFHHLTIYSHARPPAPRRVGRTGFKRARAPGHSGGHRSTMLSASLRRLYGGLGRRSRQDSYKSWLHAVWPQPLRPPYSGYESGRSQAFAAWRMERMPSVGQTVA